MKTKTSSRKLSKFHFKIMTREWKSKFKNIQNNRLVDSRIVNEFNRKSQIKKKSFHLRFSSSTSKMNSSLNSKSFKEIDVFNKISFEEFHTDSRSSNSEESLKKLLKCFILYLFRDSWTCRKKMAI